MKITHFSPFFHLFHLIFAFVLSKSSKRKYTPIYTRQNCRISGQLSIRFNVPDSSSVGEGGGVFSRPRSEPPLSPRFRFFFENCSNVLELKGRFKNFSDLGRFRQFYGLKAFDEDSDIKSRKNKNKNNKITIQFIKKNLRK